MFRYLPEQASEIAPKIDDLNNLVTDISVFFTVIIVGAMLFFAIKYRKRNGVNHETPQIHGNNFLEIIWTVVPTVICIYILYYGFTVFYEMRSVPKGAIQISVWGQKWKWDFEYENGKKTTGELVVPVDTDVKLVMTSRDVLHSFFLPEMRQKRDAVPGMYSYIIFKPVKTGTYQAYCTEYCGKDHWNMLAKLRVVSKAEYALWLEDKSAELALAGLGPVEKGKELYTSKGCNACHSLNGTTLVGPSFLKMYGKEETLTDGTKQVVDENYIQESILNPNAKIVQGFFPNMMPVFEGQVSADDIHAIIAFIKSLDTAPVEAPAPVAVTPVAEEISNLSPAEQHGKEVYTNNLCITCHSLDGTRIVGPSFKGLYGKQGKLADGRSYTADDAYIKKSIHEPNADVVEGFPPAMPSLAGQLKEQDIADLIEFIKTLK